MHFHWRHDCSFVSAVSFTCAQGPSGSGALVTIRSFPHKIREKSQGAGYGSAILASSLVIFSVAYNAYNAPGAAPRVSISDCMVLLQKDFFLSRGFSGAGTPGTGMAYTGEPALDNDSDGEGSTSGDARSDSPVAGSQR